MNSRRQNLPDLFGDEEYHQDYRGEPLGSFYSRLGFILPLTIFVISLVYHILYRLDFDLLPLPELLWNCIVFLTPYRLLDFIENYMNPLRLSNPSLRPRTHAAKSEILRRILGLDTQGGIIEPVTTAARRRLSSLPVIKSMSQESDGRPPGLGNWDNSCYQNSVLQGLSSLGPALSKYLANPYGIEQDAQKNMKPDLKMADALRELISTLNDPTNGGKRIWTPATLKSMSSWQQQDAQEYFSKVLDEIDKEMVKAVAVMKSFQHVEGNISTTYKPTDVKIPPISDLRSPLEGLIAQRVGCTNCGYSEGLSMIPFNCLTVPLGNAKEYDISKCLDEYTKLERIEGVECGKCTLLKFQRLLSTILERVKDTPDDSQVRKTTQERLEAVAEALEDDDYEEKTLLQKCKIPSKNRVSSTKTRQAVIARPPKSLVVHFNRSLFDEYTGELKKNVAGVRFPKLLDLAPWCLGSSYNELGSEIENWVLNPDESLVPGSSKPSRLSGPLYELRAVVTHYGRHENGHYICYKKHPDSNTDEKGHHTEQWWRLSDDDVWKVSEENVLSQGGVFMLFFNLIEDSITVKTPAAPPNPSLAPEQTHILELDIAAGVPLPSADDSDLIEANDLAPGEADVDKSVTGSTTDDDYDNEETSDTEYKPTEPIHVQPYLANNLHNEDGASAKRDIMNPKNLVMV